MDWKKEFSRFFEKTVIIKLKKCILEDDKVANKKNDGMGSKSKTALKQQKSCAASNNTRVF